MKKSTYFFIICIIILLTYSVAKMGYIKGYDKGAKDGITATLDTMLNIVSKQVDKAKPVDTTVRLSIVTKDTNTFFLSPKTIKLTK